MRFLTVFAISALAFGCQKADDAKNSAGGADQGIAALTTDINRVINKRDSPCAEAGKNLGAFNRSNSAKIAAATKAYAAAKAKSKNALKPLARPIQNSRPAINRFRRRCPNEMTVLVGIIDQITGGDIKFKRQVATPAAASGRSGHGKGGGGGSDHGGSGDHGSGTGGGNSGGGNAAAKIPDVAKPAQTLTPARDTELRAPKKQDLAGYVSDLKGKGQLMATIETTMGKFECKLFEKRAPLTVANFVGLARGKKAWMDPAQKKVVKGDYFTGIVFHRVIPNFMLQTGDPTGTGRGGPGYRFADEFHPELRHDKPGMLSMANSGPKTNGSQFFITERPTPHLNDKHSVFGQCDNVELIKTIARVAKMPRDRSKPAKPIYITKVNIHR